MSNKYDIATINERALFQCSAGTDSERKYRSWVVKKIVDEAKTDMGENTSR